MSADEMAFSRAFPCGGRGTANFDVVEYYAVEEETKVCTNGKPINNEVVL